MTVGALITARLRSTRLPAKALLKICGRATLGLLIERLQQVRSIEKVVLCTTTEPEDTALEQLAREMGIGVYRGSVDDVAGRMLAGADAFAIGQVVRVTGDDLLRDIDHMDAAVASHLESGADYTAMTRLPYGCDSEILKRSALERIVKTAVCPANTEYLTWYLDNPDYFSQNRFTADVAYDRPYRLTLDTPEDLQVMTAVHEALYRPGVPVPLLEALQWLDEHPETADCNRQVRPKLNREALDLRLRDSGKED